jgi:hypothetical protein
MYSFSMAFSDRDVFPAAALGIIRKSYDDSTAEDSL